jgi:hypothetical protein
VRNQLDVGEAHLFPIGFGPDGLIPQTVTLEVGESVANTKFFFDGAFNTVKLVLDQVPGSDLKK